MIPERGKVRECCAAELFWRLRTTGRTGRVMFVDGATRRIVFIENGRPVWAVSNEPQDRLGQIFLQQRLINQLQLDFAIERCPVGMKLGAVLVKLKFITPEDLIKGVKYRTKRIILGTFCLTAGYFFIKDEPLNDEDIVRLRMDTEVLVREGIQNVSNPEILMQRLGSMEHQLYVKGLAGHEGALTGVTGQDKALLALLDTSGRTLRDICRNSGMPAIATCQSLFFLELKGLVGVLAPKKEAEAIPPKQAMAV